MQSLQLNDAAVRARPSSLSVSELQLIVRKLAMRGGSFGAIVDLTLGITDEV